MQTDPLITTEGRHWFQRGLWSLIDQGLFSGANFIGNILLARWLVPAEYGAFAFSFAVFLLFGAVHTAILSDPMLIFSAGRFKEQVTPYRRFLLYAHAIFGLVSLVLLGLASVTANQLGSPALGHALLGASLATPWILLAWLVRRAFYIDGRAKQAALASLLFAVCLLGSLSVLQQAGVLRPLSAYGCLALASLLMALAFGREWWASLRTPPASEKASAGMLQTQWGYARWSALTALLLWVPLNIFFVLPYASGLSTTAELRSVNNALTPLIQGTAALTTLSLPVLSKTYSEVGRTAVMQTTKRLLVGFVGLAALYWLVLFSFHRPLFDLLYAGHYQAASPLLWLGGGIPLLFGLGALLENALRSMERPKEVMHGYLAAALVCGSLGLWLAHEYQALGALLGQNMAFVALTIVLSGYLFKQPRNL